MQVFAKNNMGRIVATVECDGLSNDDVLDIMWDKLVNMRLCGVFRVFRHSETRDRNRKIDTFEITKESSTSQA